MIWNFLEKNKVKPFFISIKPNKKREGSFGAKVLVRHQDKDTVLSEIEWPGRNVYARPWYYSY